MGVLFDHPEALRINARHMFSIPLSHIKFSERLRHRISSFFIISRSIIFPTLLSKLLADRSRDVTFGHPFKDSTSISTCLFYRLQFVNDSDSSYRRRGITSAIG